MGQMGIKLKKTYYSLVHCILVTEPGIKKNFHFYVEIWNFSFYSIQSIFTEYAEVMENPHFLSTIFRIP